MTIGKKSVIFFILVLLSIVFAVYKFTANGAFNVPHNVAVINVVYNGKPISPNDLEVYYYIGSSPTRGNPVRLSPGINGTFSVKRGEYGPQGFLVKVKANAVGAETSRLFGYAFAYYPNNSMYQTIVENLEIQKSDKGNYQGILTITAMGDLSFYLKKELEFRLTQEENIADLGYYGP